MRKIGKQIAAGMHKQNNRLLILSYSNCANQRTGQPNNDDDYFTPPTNHEDMDSKMATAMKTVPGPFNAVDTLAKRI